MGIAEDERKCRGRIGGVELAVADFDDGATTLTWCCWTNATREACGTPVWQKLNDFRFFERVRVLARWWWEETSLFVCIPQPFALVVCKHDDTHARGVCYVGSGDCSPGRRVGCVRAVFFAAHLGVQNDDQ